MKYALTHCNVLDGTKNMVLQHNMIVIIEGKKISSIKEGGEVPSDAVEVDLQGKYLLPGMINMHVHLPGSGKPRKIKKNSHMAVRADRFKFLQERIAERVKENILTQLYSGVTTIRSMGEIAHTDLKNRDRINKGEYIGPRVLVSGYGITGINGHMVGTMAIECYSPNQSKELVQREATQHVDWVKLFVTSGVMDALSIEEPAVMRMPLKIAQAACDEAHALGFKVAAHAQSQEGVRVSLQAGVDTVEHGAIMDEEIVKLYKKNNAAMIITLSPAVAGAKLSTKLTKMADLQKVASETILFNMIEGAKQALANDIPVGLGTDSSCSYITHYDMWRELYYFAKYCKVSNEFAIHSATLGNAKILGVDQEIGSIEVGKYADLMVVSKNPLEALQNLRHVEMVMIKGQLLTKLKIRRMEYIDKALDEIRNSEE